MNELLALIREVDNDVDDEFNIDPFYIVALMEELEGVPLNPPTGE